MKGEWSLRGRILDCIDQKGSGHVYRLAHGLGEEESSVYEACKSLNEAGVLEAKDPHKRGKVEYFLTQKARIFCRFGGTSRKATTSKQVVTSTSFQEKP